VVSPVIEFELENVRLLEVKEQLLNSFLFEAQDLTTLSLVTTISVGVITETLV
jgi:hypothetical protein